MFTIAVFLFLSFMWQFLSKYWEKYQRDYARHRLFRLRDAWREYFEMREDLSTSLPIYEEVRLLLNNHIKYLKKSSLSDLKIIIKYFAENPDFAKMKQAERSKLYKVNDKGLQSVVNSIRHESSLILLYNMYNKTLIGSFCFHSSMLLYAAKNKFSPTTIDKQLSKDKRVKYVEPSSCTLIHV